jgi:hypothetical protein
MTGEAPLVVARALLRSARGERPGIDVPISAENVARLAPAPQAVEAVANDFLRAGFDILGKPGVTIGISGPKELFERYFGIELVLLTDQTYSVRSSQRSGRSIDPTEIPLESLPQRSRQLISQIALEVAVSIDHQPRANP